MEPPILESDLGEHREQRHFGEDIINSVLLIDDVASDVVAETTV